MGNNPCSMRSLVGERPAIFTEKKSKMLMTRYNFLAYYARHTVYAKNIRNSIYLKDLWNYSNKKKFSKLKLIKTYLQSIMLQRRLNGLTVFKNFEHSNISITLFMYASFSIILDKLAPPAQYGLAYMLGAIAFGQQLLLFHLHSADHMGIEGQYHWLLQIAIFTSLATTLLGINYPKSFLNSFARSVSIMFQGVWLMVMGFMLWTPEFMPKGCFMNLERGHKVVRCHGEEALERAKSLVNIQFSWYVVGVTICSVSLYLIMIRLYQEKVEYQSITKFEEQEEEDEDDVEAQKKEKLDEPKSSFLQMGKSFAPFGHGKVEGR